MHLPTQHYTYDLCIRFECLRLAKVQLSRDKNQPVNEFLIFKDLRCFIPLPRSRHRFFLFCLQSHSDIEACSQEKNWDRTRQPALRCWWSGAPWYGGGQYAKSIQCFISINIFQNFASPKWYIQGDFFHWYPPKKFKYGKPRLGESTA